MRSEFYMLTTLVVVILSITFPIVASTSAFLRGNETDRLALLAFRSVIKHDPLGSMSSWNDSSHFCEWEGVTCGRRHKRVTILDLHSRGLAGSLSPYIGNMSFLRVLRLSNNTIQGEIPPEVGRLFRLQRLGLHNNSLEGPIPANISHCSNLIFLGLAGNMLVGNIPKELSSLSKLTDLVIEKNNLSGGIPHFIGNITSLVTIYARINDFGGTIPDALSKLESLTTLALANNKLSGIVPPSIFNLSSLEVFSVSGNQLHGTIPPNIGLTLPNLDYFQVASNQFSGPLPPSLSNASKLAFVHMSSNNFNGKISTNFGHLKDLWYLSLQYNNLGSGEADEMVFLRSLANCSKLERATFVYNQLGGMLPKSCANKISGGIPSWICYLVNLGLLGLEFNQFSGTIPSNIGNLQKLQILALNTNRLSGRIPDSIGNLSLLNGLHLEENRLQGTVPSSLENCQALAWLNLAQNNLNGTIPKELFGIPHLSISLNLARNQLSGSLPSEVGNLKNLAELDVSENNLSGEIPSSLSGCTILERLYLDSNLFQGPIPSSFHFMRGIQELDLSHNNLSGQIPDFLQNLSMMHLNLSFNNFEGEVPRRGIFSNASAISVIGNNRLCGGIAEIHLPKCAIQEQRKQKMSLALILIISAACVLGVFTVSSSVFCLLKKKRKNKKSLVPLRKEPFLKVSYEMLLKATDGFSSSNLIGVGSFGSVYKGILEHDGTIVAIKVLNHLHQRALKSFKAECEALRNIRHRNLVKVITSCSSVDFQGNDFRALVYEFMSNGNLDKWLHSCLQSDNVNEELQKLNLLQRINIAIDVACAIEYLHRHCHTPVIHCDLKPSNILLDSDMVAHVGDFGLVRFVPELSNQCQTSSIGIRGTIGHTPPEYGLGSEVSADGDVYSYGILLLEMMTGKRPTDPMFEESLNLHNFAKTAFPDRVIQIVDPILVQTFEINNNRRNGSREVEECLVSMVRIGLASSEGCPQDRMDISKVIQELHLTRNNLQGTHTHLQITQGPEF